MINNTKPDPAGPVDCRVSRHSVVSYGAGTNSTAMLVGLHERGERPDFIIFADTGGENNLWTDWIEQDEKQCKLFDWIEPYHVPCGCYDG